MLTRLKFDLTALTGNILNDMPEEYFISETTTFLDPAMGGGQFVEAINNKLRSYGHSDSNIKSRVFGIELLPHRLNYAVNKRRIGGKQLLGNFEVADFLTKDFDVRFDVIIGNPPYQLGENSNFYVEFIIKANSLLEYGGTFSFVMPNRFLRPGSKAAKAMKPWLDVSSVLPHVNQHFPGVGTDIGVITGIKKEVVDADKKVPFKFNNGSIVLRALSSITPTVSPDQYSINIIDSLVNNKLPKLVTEDVATGNNYVYVAPILKRYCPTKDRGGLLNLQTVLNGCGNFYGGHYVNFKEYAQAETNNWFMSRSLLGRFATYCFTSDFRAGGLLTKGLFPQIPVAYEGEPTLNNDSAVFKLFGITQDEERYIRAVLLKQ